MSRAVQIVLQGGGARLSDLIAVGEALAELHLAQQINITRVAGTSAGSIVACMLASGIPMSHFKCILQREAPKALKQIFLASYKPIIYFRIIRGRPILNEQVFRSLLETLFTHGNRQYRIFSDLKIPAFVVTTNLTEARREIRGFGKLGRDDSIIPAMVDSCSLPFAFRTHRDKGLSVDGGICANLPGQELIDEVEQFGPILGISFHSNVHLRFPSRLFEYAGSLLFTAMDNSVRAAKDQIEKSGGSVLLIDSKTTTFDFATALANIKGSDEYDRVREEAKKWVECKTSDPRWLPKSRFNGEARKVGLSAIYERREQTAENIIADIRNSESSCRLYAGRGLPELCDTNFGHFTDALAEAAIRCLKQARRREKYRFSFTCLDWWSDTRPKDLLNLWLKRERIPESEGGSLPHTYFRRVAQETAKLVLAKLAIDSNDLEKALDYIEIEHRVFKDYPCPRAMCIVDDIVYIGLYEWAHEHGTPNPAFRLDPSPRTEEGMWTKVFLSEAEIIDRDYSKEGLDTKRIIAEGTSKTIAPPGQSEQP